MKRSSWSSLALSRGSVLTLAAFAVTVSVRHWELRTFDAHAAEIERHEALRRHSETGEPEQAGLGAAVRDDLIARGVIGPERRLDWIDRLAQLAQAHDLASLEYELAPQQPAGIESLPLATGRYEFLASRMKLKLGLLHEQQLLDFLDDLARPDAAMLRLRACRIERIADRPADARLAADCTVDWITLRDKP
jgi:hypothetical protein